MKKTAVLCAILAIAQGLNAFSFFQSSATENESNAEAVSSDQGGTVTIGGETYDVPAGQTLTVTGGGITAQTGTTQEGSQEPVTTLNIEEHPQTVKVGGKVAQPIQEEQELTPEEDAQLDAYLDEDDAYED